MKLNRLEISNFAGITNADIDLTAPVNVILGDNASGKTSVMNAVEIVVCEGLCESRGYRKKNQAPGLTHRGEGKWKVRMTTDSGTYERAATSTGSRGDTPAIGLELAQIAVCPQSVLTMKPADRQRIFASIAADDTEVKGKIKAYLKKEGFGDEVQKMCCEDMSKVQEWIIQQRQAAKRVKGEMQVVIESEAPPASVEVEGEERDLTALNETLYSSRLIVKQVERDKVMLDLGSVTSEMAQIAPDNKIPSVEGFSVAKAAQETALAEIDTTKAEEAVTSTKNALNMAVNTLWKRKEAITALTAAITSISKAESAVEDLQGHCPTCGTEVTAESKTKALKSLTEQRDKVDSDLKLLDIDLANAQKKVETCNNRHKKCEQDLDTLNLNKENHKVEIKGIKQQIEDASKFVQLKIKHDELEKQKTEVEQNLSALNQIIDAWGKWDAHRQSVHTAELSIKSQENLIMWADKLDKLLKPDGAVRMIANQKIEGSNFDNELQHAWGMESLKLEADGTITFDGAPIEAACATEQYRAGVLLAELLSRTLALGVLILDGVDLLRKPLKDALFARLTNGWAKTFESIIILAAVDVKPQGLAGNGQIQFHWIKNGTVEPFQKAAVA